MSRVLVLDYSTDAALGPATARWLPAAVPVQLWTMIQGQPLPSLDGFTHLVHSGSALSINDDAPFLAAAFERVQQAVARGVGQLGICYGHQLLARALCGRRAVRRCPEGPEIGWLPVDFDPGGRELFGVAPRCRIWQFHYDEVVEVPDGSAVLAHSPHSAIQAFHDPVRRALGMQFHPEVDRELGNRIFRDKAEQLACTGHDAEELARGRPEGFDLYAVMARFVADAY